MQNTTTTTVAVETVQTPTIQYNTPLIANAQAASSGPATAHPSAPQVHESPVRFKFARSNTPGQPPTQSSASSSASATTIDLDAQSAVQRILASQGVSVPPQERKVRDISSHSAPSLGVMPATRLAAHAPEYPLPSVPPAATPFHAYTPEYEVSSAPPLQLRLKSAPKPHAVSDSPATSSAAPKPHAVSDSPATSSAAPTLRTRAGEESYINRVLGYANSFRRLYPIPQSHLRLTGDRPALYPRNITPDRYEPNDDFDAQTVNRVAALAAGVAVQEAQAAVGANEIARFDNSWRAELGTLVRMARSMPGMPDSDFWRGVLAALALIGTGPVVWKIYGWFPARQPQPQPPRFNIDYRVDLTPQGPSFTEPGEINLFRDTPGP